MIHEVVGCQCPRCGRYREFRQYVDPLFDAEIEKRVRARTHPVKPVPTYDEEWPEFLANVRAALKFISSAMRSVIEVRLN